MTWPDRLLRPGRFASAEDSRADGHGRQFGRKQGDLNLITVGSERCEIAVATLFGGRAP